MGLRQCNVLIVARYQCQHKDTSDSATQHNAPTTTTASRPSTSERYCPKAHHKNVHDDMRRLTIYARACRWRQNGRKFKRPFTFGKNFLEKQPKFKHCWCCCCCRRRRSLSDRVEGGESTRYKPDTSEMIRNSAERYCHHLLHTHTHNRISPTLSSYRQTKKNT